MKEEILDIAKKLYHNHLTPETATELLLKIIKANTPQLFCSMTGVGFCPYEGDNGKCNVVGKCVNQIVK